MLLTGPPPVLSEVVTCNCVRNPGGHAESNPRPSDEGVSFYHVFRPLDHGCAHASVSFLHSRVCERVACMCVRTYACMYGDVQSVFLFSLLLLFFMVMTIFAQAGL